MWPVRVQRLACYSDATAGLSCLLDDEAKAVFTTAENFAQLQDNEPS